MRYLVSPFPIADFRHVVAVLRDVALVFGQPVTEELFDMAGFIREARDAVDDIASKVEPIQIVEHGHIERRSSRPFFLVSTHVQIIVIGSFIGQAMDQPWVPVVGEHDGLVGCENR